jgi:hypothetical protein
VRLTLFEETTIISTDLYAEPRDIWKTLNEFDCIYIVYAKYLDIILQTRVILGQVFLKAFAVSCVMLGESGYVDISLFVVDPCDRVYHSLLYGSTNQTCVYEMHAYCSIYKGVVILFGVSDFKSILLHARQSLFSCPNLGSQQRIHTGFPSQRRIYYI